ELAPCRVGLSGKVMGLFWGAGVEVRATGMMNSNYGGRYKVGWWLMIGAGRLANDEVKRGLKAKSCSCQGKDPKASRRQIMTNHWVLDPMKLSG
ncbi:hypothetical protein Tco_1441113, partial [Tanacetum coccineum]